MNQFIELKDSSGFTKFIHIESVYGLDLSVNGCGMLRLIRPDNQIYSIDISECAMPVLLEFMRTKQCP